MKLKFCKLLKRLIMSIIYGNDGMPSDVFMPERPVGSTEEGRVISQVPSGINSQILGSIEPVEDSADIFKGKSFRYIRGDFVGTKVRAQRMVKEGNKFFVYFDNNQKHSVEEIQGILTEIDEFPDDLSLIRPGQLGSNINLDPYQQVAQVKQVVFDPVIEILKKGKFKTKSITLVMDLNIPPKELYDILIDNYDDAEIKIIDFLFTPENLEILKEGIKGTLKEHYGNS